MICFMEVVQPPLPEILVLETGMPVGIVREPKSYRVKEVKWYVRAQNWEI